MSDTTRPRLKVSREGIVLIKSFEGFRPRAVQTEAGGWLIGYGHTASAREGATVGEQDAELLLHYDLMPVVKALNEGVSAPLNQHQFDALASFAISVGVDRFLASDVLTRLNEGRAGEAADALIGWPQAAAPDSALRRRAAERALFVADPASPVHLADLLASPLPPPGPFAPGPETFAQTPALSADDAPDISARSAAVAALLGETPVRVDAPADAPALTAEPTAQEETVPPANAFAPSSFTRYSPYAATIIGPLPGFPPAGQPASPAAAAPGVVATPEEGEPEPSEPEIPGDALTAGPAPVHEPIVPFFPAEVTPLVSPPATPSPFPPIDELVLTPPTEADFVEFSRPVWSTEADADEPTQVLFEDEPTVSVLRHEVEPEQQTRFDWSETGAFLIMGTVGLAACGAAAAAFRKAMLDTAPIDDYAIIGWVLALIGAVCVGVSSWNLYVGWGRSR